MEGVASQAIESVCRNSHAVCFQNTSEEFRTQCTALLINQKKSVVLRSIVNDLGSVFSGQMSEGVFVRKYC